MAGRVAGTGLGLAIARDIAELHLGRLTVESEVGHGASFTLTLLAQRLEAQPADASGAQTGAVSSLAPQLVR
jgi:signal transduction histidine kinase